MFKKCEIIFSLVFFLCFTTCIQQKANDPSDFNIMDHGTWIEITGYRGTSNIVVVPNRINGKPVTSIGNGAFSDPSDPWNYQGNLTKITIPSSVVEIGDDAFAGNQLSSFTIPNKVAKIGDRAFWGNQLTSITIPSSVTKIGVLVFKGNPITNISLASGNIEYTIKDYFLLSKDEKIVFMYGGKEKDIIIPNGVNEIANYAFSGNQLTGVSIPNSVTIIGVGAFSDNQLTNVTIPGSVTAIRGQRTFDATTLNSITFEGNNVEIQYYAFNQDGRNRGELVREYQSGGTGTYIRNGRIWTKQ